MGNAFMFRSAAGEKHGSVSPKRNRSVALHGWGSRCSTWFMWTYAARVNFVRMSCTVNIQAISQGQNEVPNATSCASKKEIARIKVFRTCEETFILQSTAKRNLGPRTKYLVSEQRSETKKCCIGRLDPCCISMCLQFAALSKCS